MRCSSCRLVEDREFIAVLNLQMWGVRGSPERVGGFEGDFIPNDGPMKTNPYGIMAVEKQRIGLKFHEITLTSP